MVFNAEQGLWRRNIGSFDLPLRVKDEIPAEIQLQRLSKLVLKNNVLKEHNADYLSNEALSWHPRLGIHAANIAPEFGSRNRALLIFLKQILNI